MTDTIWQRLRRAFTPRAAYNDMDAERYSGAAALMRNASGINVNEYSALAQAAVWACVRVISESLAMLPVDVVERSNGARRQQDKARGVGWLLNYSPDGEISAFDLRSALCAHAVLWGNGYAEIERDLAGRPIAMHILQPDRVEPRRDDAGALVYDVWDGGGRKTQLASRDVFHWRGLSWDGVKGYSVVSQARQSLGLSAAMETFGASFFGNSASPIGALSTDATLKEEQIAAMRKMWEDTYRGASRGNKIAILHGGLKFNPISMPLEDAQFIDGRRFQVLEIARWFRVPPHLLAELDRATHTNIEHEQLNFVTHCLMPWAVRFESEANIKLFGRNQQARVVIKHNFAALLRGDQKTRAEALQIQRRNGVISANEWREIEDMNPIADGDAYIVEANMTTIDRVGGEPAAAGTPDAQTDAVAASERIARALASAPAPVVNATINCPPQTTIVESPQIHSHVSVPERSVTVEAAKVQVDAPVTVEVPERSVTVEAPKVQVDAPVSVSVPEREVRVEHHAAPVTVEPAQVKVTLPKQHIDVAGPQVVLAQPRRIVDRIERDANNEITTIVREAE